ncbi:hypothetical protein TRFO_30959 [Tritrichomonas foetus]|uniref:Uncharacterized protein n=1 Tax=Tritrichomonas foetus TaxID=1144522 RepID=A0A1J4JSL7_9EUKA|nr:hypothetical protein TRFO_30959 [Tritrichomonas foetus]|eukprot:OHT02043.1 hypothetical protein TRFO_30959 [Tritrichomonas foetus]
MFVKHDDINNKNWKLLESTQNLLRNFTIDSISDTINHLQSMGWLEFSHLHRLVHWVFRSYSANATRINLYVELFKQLNTLIPMEPTIKYVNDSGVFSDLDVLLSRLFDEGIIKSNETFHYFSIEEIQSRSTYKARKAIECDNVLVLQRLIASGLDINSEIHILHSDIFPNFGYVDMMDLTFPYYGDVIFLIEYSALCSSFQCFKYLYVSGGKLRKLDRDESCDILSFAIQGGNTEIIHFLINEGRTFLKDHVYDIAASFNDAMFDWIWENDRIKIEEMLQPLLQWQYAHGLMKIYEFRVTIHKNSGFHDSTFEVISKTNFCEYLEYLSTKIPPKEFLTTGNETSNYGTYLECEEIYFQVAYDKNKSLFHAACEDGMKKIVNDYRERFGTKLSLSDLQGLTPMQCAQKYGQKEIIELLLQKHDELLKLRDATNCLSINELLLSEDDLNLAEKPVENHKKLQCEIYNPFCYENER